MAGAALLALGVVCWLARYDGQSCAARGLVCAMALYNVGATTVLTYAGIGYGLRSLALWPAVILHAGMILWCIACLRRKPPDERSATVP